jgi:diaminopimelate epimerase
MNHIPFFKMSGSGNDFIIIDHRKKFIDESALTRLITGVCRRKLSVGADGFILIEDSKHHDFSWRFYNSDGSRAEMCGNGARCAARFARLNGIAGSELSFETDAGVISAQIMADRVKVNMPDPTDLSVDFSVDLAAGSMMVSSANTGVPHVIILQDQIDDLDVVGVGREIRYHRDFAPAGTNVNFICRDDDNAIAIRTYERGVEDETLACGTGSIASALVAAHKLEMTSPIDVMTRSGEHLTIYFAEDNGRFHGIFMEGDARVVYSGELWEEAWK